MTYKELQKFESRLGFKTPKWIKSLGGLSFGGNQKPVGTGSAAQSDIRTNLETEPFEQTFTAIAIENNVLSGIATTGTNMGFVKVAFNGERAIAMSNSGADTLEILKTAAITKLGGVNLATAEGAQQVDSSFNNRYTADTTSTLVRIRKDQASMGTLTVAGAAGLLADYSVYAWSVGISGNGKRAFCVGRNNATAFYRAITVVMT